MPISLNYTKPLLHLASNDEVSWPNCLTSAHDQLPYSGIWTSSVSGPYHISSVLVHVVCSIWRNLFLPLHLTKFYTTSSLAMYFLFPGNVWEHLLLPVFSYLTPSHIPGFLLLPLISAFIWIFSFLQYKSFEDRSSGRISLELLTEWIKKLIT